MTSADGTRLAVEEWGPEGAPELVFVHGIAQSRRSFEDVLVPGFRHVAFDLRGHGDSDKPDAAYGPGVLGEDLRAVLEGRPRAVVVAWSYAGVVLGEYLRQGGRPAGIVLVAAALKVGKPSRGLLGATMTSNGRAMMSADAATYRAGAHAFLEGCLPSYPTWMLDEMERAPVTSRAALLARHEDFLAEYAKVDVPMAMLHGTADTVVLPAMSELLAEARPDVPLRLVPGAGHLPWVTDAEALALAVRLVAR